MIKILLGLGVLIIAGYAAFPQYRQAIASLSPYLLILACPIAMFFMMDSKKAPPPDNEKKSDQSLK